MLEHIFSKLRKDPLGLIHRGLHKTIIGPLKYGMVDDYDAHRYWYDRLSKYGNSIQGVGNEALSGQETKTRYKEAAQAFTALCRGADLDFPSVRVLEMGCGTGFYTQLLHHFGAKNYVGVDITDVLFPTLRKRFPQFAFLRTDMTSDLIEGEFDLIVMIDVLQHIVTEGKLAFGMENVKNCLSADGLFVVAPIDQTSKGYPWRQQGASTRSHCPQRVCISVLGP